MLRQISNFHLPMIPCCLITRFITGAGIVIQHKIIIYFDISKFPMINKENKANGSLKQKTKKDYLYKVAKIRQNNLFHEKNINQQFEQEGLGQNQQKTFNYDDQQQIDFEINLPLPQLPKSNKKEVQSQHDKSKLRIIEHKKENQIKNNEQQQFENIKFEQKQYSKNQIIKSKEKIKNQEEQKLYKQRQLKQQENKNRIAQQLVQQPFIFDDFQDEELQQQQQNCQNNGVDQTHNNKHITISQQSPSESNESERQIKGMTITSSVLEGNVMIKITNKVELIMSRLPPGIILKCIIRRPSDIFNPEFDFYINNGMKHLISAKKYSFAKKQIFNLSLELGKYRLNDIVGTIMANTVHNTYWLYKQDKTQTSFYEIKAIIKYAKAIRPNFREMSVHLFTDPHKNSKVQQANLIHQNHQQADLILRNNFNQQKQSSTKNFSLFDLEDNQYEYLKMKKVSDNMFEVQIQHPLSPFQAFAIALTRFDAQLK